MGSTALLALAANVSVAVLLFRYRGGDSNMRSVWLCSRNDALGNIAVLLAASAVFVTGTRWPDLLVAGVIAALALHSARDVLRQSRIEIRTGRADYDPASVVGHGD
jgi:Co/Zn/Cd efflux system component